ncbi:hypothetical protein D9757_011884 [Collybiopsis confluens]|uniref:Uncharacterized protein n=1 Tax=Collybiopsis confluens TaxID=2823264 RepID=A0A8H5LR97_9AGAR|nr:hypothetical protein D9757_011884 [Collybiopsis confluens]
MSHYSHTRYGAERIQKLGDFRGLWPSPMRKKMLYQDDFPNHHVRVEPKLWDIHLLPEIVHLITSAFYTGIPYMVMCQPRQLHDSATLPPSIVSRLSGTNKLPRRLSRPEQFPHKRGPLTTSALRGRSPPLPSPPHTLPPPMRGPPSSQGSPLIPNTLPPISQPPYPYTHPSLAPINSISSSQPPNGSQHMSRRAEEMRRPWQERESPPVSKRSPSSNGRTSPFRSLSSGSENSSLPREA